MAVALTIGFLLLSYFDSQFYLIHFYESLIYLVIIVLLFFFENQWAYMFGMVMPGVWLVLSLVMGFLPGMSRQISLLAHLRRPNDLSSLIGACIAVLSVILIFLSAYRWRREFAGLGKGSRAMAVSLGVAAAYYGWLAVWMLQWPPSAS